MLRMAPWMRAVCPATPLNPHKACGACQH
jgi:hypothetical protein